VWLDLAGTFVFALSGALTGVRHRLDLLGVLVLAFVAGNVGGITRDVLLGAVPPPAIGDWRYIVASFVAGLLTFRWQQLVARLRSPVLVIDAAGLALFAVAGAQKAVAFHLNPLAAALIGALTGVGGGVVRDLLVAEVPTVLISDLYAVAALAGATVVVLGNLLRLPAAPVAVAGAVLCLGLRLGAIRRGWGLPRARPPVDAGARDPRER
jgi:uncharacterized membrane protein YeiH